MSSPTMAVKAGDEQEVPATPSTDPPTMTSKFSPWAETSGIPAPEALKREDGGRLADDL